MSVARRTPVHAAALQIQSLDVTKYQRGTSYRLQCLARQARDWKGQHPEDHGLAGQSPPVRTWCVRRHSDTGTGQPNLQTRTAP